MSKTARNWMIVIAVLLIAGLGGWAWQRQARASRFVQSTTPTIFFHGGDSSYRAEEHMVNAAKKAGVTKTVIRANVDRTGKVTLRGTIPKGAINPIVEVNYENNRQLDFNQHGVWATRIVQQLKDRDGIKQVNMVGHSLGNISILYYELQNGQNQAMPQVQKQVDIAGHFDGLNFKNLPANITQPAGLKLDANGKPNAMNGTYQQLTQLRTTYPKEQTRVLNIVGDTGNQTDGTVSNASSLSLRYLLASRAKSYQTKIIRGQDAQHSRLHENPVVDRLLINFLWGK